jgi:hypothetical protein
MKRTYTPIVVLLLLLYTGYPVYAENNIAKSTMVLVMNWDENNSSAGAIVTALTELGLSCDVEVILPDDLTIYDGIFVCLGIYSENHILSDSEGQLLKNYLDAGGSLYMEGGDTWAFNSPTPVHVYFNIYGENDGTGDMGTVSGEAGTFTEGMSFNYSGENSWMDHISPIGDAFLILKNQSPYYGTAVAYDGGTYKTIGAGHEFAGLDDATSPSTKLDLMEAYCNFLGIPMEIEASFMYDNDNPCAGSQVQFTNTSSGQIVSYQWTFESGVPATSTDENPIITYNTTGLYDVTLIISDGSDTDTLTLEQIIEVSDVPEVPDPPVGIAILCDVTNSSYSINVVPFAESYDWIIEPADAGLIIGNSNNIIIQWNEDFYGTASLKAASVNFCGLSEYSFPIIIQRYPENAILDFANPVITSDEEPFLLNEGFPGGGTYEGEGVIEEAGEYYFDPSISGIGEFIITYAYNGFCGASTASDTLFVQAVGIPDHLNHNISIIPNPNAGIFTVQTGKITNVNKIKIVNLMGEEVCFDRLNSQSIITIDASTLEAGIYIVQIDTPVATFTKKIIIK